MPLESVEERSVVSSDDLLPSNKHKLKLHVLSNPPFSAPIPFSCPSIHALILFIFYFELAWHRWKQRGKMKSKRKIKRNNLQTCVSTTLLFVKLFVLVKAFWNFNRLLINYFSCILELVMTRGSFSLTFFPVYFHIFCSKWFVEDVNYT